MLPALLLRPVRRQAHRLARLEPRLSGGDQPGDPAPERIGERHDGVERRSGVPTFDQADVVVVQPRALGELRLRPPVATPLRSNRFAERNKPVHDPSEGG